MAISNLLSNEEISALLNSRQSSAAFGSYGNAHDQKVVEPLNFMNTPKKEGVPSAGFNAGNEKFVADLSIQLSKFLQQKVRVEMVEPRIIAYDEYINTLEHPTILSLVHLKSPRHLLIVNVKHPLLYQIVNILFGGNAAKDKGGYQEFGKIDLKINHRLVGLILESLANAWKEVCQIEVKQTTLVTRPSTITAIPLQHSMFLTSYVLTINNIKTELQLVFDADMLEDLKLEFNTLHQAKTDKKEDKRWKDKLQESVYDTVLPAIAAFPSIELKLAELSRLKEGDVIFLENHQMVDVYIAGLKIFSAQCGVSEGTRVIKINEYTHRN